MKVTQRARMKTSPQKCVHSFHFLGETSWPPTILINILLLKKWVSPVINPELTLQSFLPCSGAADFLPNGFIALCSSLKKFFV